MAFFRRPVTYTVGIRVYNREQKENLLDTAKEWADKTSVKSYNRNEIDYELRFDYATNYYGFKQEYDSTRYPYKGKYLYTNKD